MRVSRGAHRAPPASARGAASQHGLHMARPAVQPHEDLQSFARSTTTQLQDLLRKPIALDDRLDLHVVAPPSWLTDLWRALPVGGRARAARVGSARA